MNTELEWLRYFYGNAHCGMGPASDEIYSMIKESYLNSGGVIPLEYMDEDEDEL